MTETFIVDATLPPLPFPQIARHELTQLRNDIAGLYRENARILETLDIVLAQIAALQAAQGEHIGLAVAVEK